MTKSPSGFFQSEAIFARNLFGATPADAVKLTSERICSRIMRATAAREFLSVMGMFRQLRRARTLITSRVFIDLTYFFAVAQAKFSARFGSPLPL